MYFFQAFRAMGTVSVLVSPPLKRTCAVISVPRVSVTSSIISATMRFFSRIGVRGSFQRRGKSEASAMIFPRFSSSSTCRSSER